MKTLGISYNRQHDSSCALMVNKELVYAISEERITRVKQDSSFPINSIKAALEYASLQPEDIDYVTISWPSPLVNMYHNIPFDLGQILSIKNFSISMLKKMIFLYQKGGFRRYQQNFGTRSKLLFCSHHLTHALSTYSYSSFDEATIVILDGRGSFESTSIWYAKDGQIKPVEIIKYPNSLGMFYAKFTKFLGFKPLSDEWKVMGLAPYGEDGIDLSMFIDVERKKPYQVNGKKLHPLSINDTTFIEKYLGKSRKESDDISQRDKDIAFAVQKACEKAVVNVVEYAIKKTGCKNLCLAGGVALNCKANGMIATSGLIDDLYVQPAASDEGCSLGAAIYPYLLKEKKAPHFYMKHAYWGNSFSSEEIQKTLDSYKLKYIKMTSPAKEVAQLIADGNIIGFFQGRMEFGPRALGGRSILGDPRNIKMKDKINESVKYREMWRPFAPSILEEHYHKIFDCKFLSPFMILSFPVKQEWQDKIPAATHVDQTARPQSVSKETNPYYWNLIHEFYKITDIPVLINTSFNLKGEPVVSTPFDAIRTFCTSGLDYLVLEDYLVSKK